MSIVLVCDDQQLQLVNIDSNFPVVTASIIDPFIVLLTQNGKILLYHLNFYNNEAILSLVIKTFLCFFYNFFYRFQF